MMPEDIETLLAREAIRDQLYTYLRALDRLDLELMNTVFHPDAIILHGEKEKGVWALQGAASDEMPRNISLQRQNAVFHSHEVANTLIRVKGNRAVSEAYLAHVCRVDREQNPSVISGLDISDDTQVVDAHYRGRYLDRWEKRDGSWRISHRQTVLDLSWTQPVHKGIVGINATRDRTDPSYALFASIDD